MPMPMTIPSSARLDAHDVNPLSGKRVDVATRSVRHARPVCDECQRRPALARIRGTWVVLKDHDVCRQCWRKWMDARRAERMAACTPAPARARRNDRFRPFASA
jgi:hypothetical protein